MSKLPKEYQFVDLSDYGRLGGRWIAQSLKHTSVTPIHVTTSFIVVGILAIACIVQDKPIIAAVLLIVKSILDAGDGELARLKQTPSYVGRYFDSISDLILNFFILLAFWYVSEISFPYMLLAFFGLQLQGTLYNFYYVILRNHAHGDTTSRIMEDSPPRALKGESQKAVNAFYHIYNVCYIIFDKIIYYLDKDAIDNDHFPKWFMTLLSTFGLGFQLLIMAVLLVLNLEDYVIPFFIFYSLIIIVFIAIRKWIL